MTLTDWMIRLVYLLLALFVLSLQAEPVFLYQEKNDDILDHGQLSSDGSYWVYVTRRQGIDRVISLSLDKQPTRVDLTHTASLNKLDNVNFIAVSPDSRWVVYGMSSNNIDYDRNTASSKRPGNILFSVPIDGSRPPIKLTLPEHEQARDTLDNSIHAVISDDSQWLVFRAGTAFHQIALDDQLYTVPIDGSQPARHINMNLTQLYPRLDDYRLSYINYGFLPGRNQVYFEYHWQDLSTGRPSSKVPRYWFKRPADASAPAQWLFAEQALPNVEVAFSPSNRVGNQWLYTSAQKSIQPPSFTFNRYNYQGRSLKLLNPAEGSITAIQTGLDEQTRFQIYLIKGSWIAYSTQDAHYVMNTQQPGQRLKISGPIPSSHTPLVNVIDILPTRELIAHTQLTLNEDNSSEGIERLYLQSFDHKQTPVQVAKGPWRIGFLHHYGQGPSFQFTADEQWLTYSNFRSNALVGQSVLDSYWIDLDRLQAPPLRWPDTRYERRVSFTPSSTRLLYTRSSPNISASSRIPFQQYDPLMLDPNASISVEHPFELHPQVLPDNCQALLIQKNQRIYKTECDRPLTELWWNPQFAGQGIRVQQIGDRLFAVWFGYDESGQPRWSTLSGQLDQGRLHGPLRAFTGPALGTPWDARLVKGRVIGQATLTFNQDQNTAHFHYQTDQQTGLVPLQPFYTGIANRYSGFWWQPDSAGQGIQLYHKGNDLFGTAYLYDDHGGNVWVSFQGPLNPRNRVFKAQLNRFTGPALGTEWRADQVKGEVVGEIRLQLDTPAFIRMQATIQGKSTHMNLIPFRF